MHCRMVMNKAENIFIKFLPSFLTEVPVCNHICNKTAYFLSVEFMVF